MTKFSKYLKKHGLISNGIYINDTKILANANKYSFVWKKSTLRYADLNKQHTIQLISEIKHAIDDDLIDYLDKFNREIDDTPQISPNPKKHNAEQLRNNFEH